MQTGDDAVVPENGPSRRTTPELAGVSVTMLWALYNRASEARRVDGALTDPDCMRIYDAIDFDFAHHFGHPQGSLSVRAAEVDRVLRRWLESHPDGLVVSLGEGLETQARRVDNGRMRWLSVDLPDAIRMREVFLQPTDRFYHISVSALDPAWMDAVDPSLGVFIVAQGLLMYLEPEDVRQLLSDIADRFPGAEMVFDVVPRWFSRLTMLGLNQTPHYRLPPMPWGINRDEVAPTLRDWNAHLSSVAFLNYSAPRGLPLLFARTNRSIPFLRHEVPSLMHITIPTTVCLSSSPDTVKSNEPGFVEVRDPYLKATYPEQQRASGDDSSGAETLGGMFAAAGRKRGRDCDFIIDAGNVIAKRVALGMAGALDPLRADYDELVSIVPEKVEAFANASMIMLDQSADTTRQLSRMAYEEAMTVARATIAMATCAGPAALFEVQTSFALAWFARASSNFAAMGMLRLNAQDAAMAPLRHSVQANVERLNCHARPDHTSGS